MPTEERCYEHRVDDSATRVSGDVNQHLREGPCSPRWDRRHSHPDRRNSMKALCWHGKTDIRCDEVPDPKIEHPRDAIVEVTSCAICGSDLHLYDGFMPGMQSGDIMGHEFMGEVVEVGAENKKLKVGDRVVVPFTIVCGEFGGVMNKGLTIRTGQTHVNRWTDDLLRRIEEGQIDPSFVITHRVKLEDGPDMYKKFRDKEDGCIKVVLHP